MIRQAISLLREGMATTGTGTMHYRKMREAVDLLTGDGYKSVDFNIDDPIAVVEGPNDSMPYNHLVRLGDISNIPVGTKLYAIPVFKKQ